MKTKGTRTGTKDGKVLAKIMMGMAALGVGVDELQESADSRYAAGENGPGNTRHDAAAQFRLVSDRLAVIYNYLRSALEKERENG